MTVIEAAGGVVRRIEPDGTPRVAVVHRPRYDDWSFPKGKCNPGEKPKAAAEREVLEEIGARVSIERKLESCQYTVGEHTKLVHYWLMAWVSDALIATDDEVDQVVWCTVPEARVKLTYDSDRALLAAVDPATRPGRIWLIRHAKAGSRYRYPGPDHTRPLTKAGVQQADALAKLLGDAPIRRLASSPYTRCVTTLEPLARRLGLTLEIDGRLGEGWPPTHLRAWCTQPEPAAICTHGDLIEAFLTELVLQDQASPDDLGTLEKGAIWRIDTVGGVVTRVRFAPNPRS